MKRMILSLIVMTAWGCGGGGGDGDADADTGNEEVAPDLQDLDLSDPDSAEIPDDADAADADEGDPAQDPVDEEDGPAHYSYMTHTWPGTETRYYPGLYPLYAVRGADNLTAEGVQNYFEAWFGGREDEYKEFVGSTPVTHLGVSVMIDPALFFTDYWKNAETQPYDWKGTCGRISEARDPDAAPGGQPLYDWDWWDDLLGQPFVAEGRGRVIVKINETYTNASNDRLPLWMRNEGYAKPATSGGRWFCQMQDWAAVYMWQDIMAAFAARYEGDSRIVSVNMDEVYPSMWENETLCGHVHDLVADRAANAGLMEIMKAYLDVDPGMLWAMVNWYPGQTPALDTWENGYGGDSIGASDLPGVQGHWRQDMHFFNDMGTGSPCTVDGGDSQYMNSRLCQHYGVTRTAPVFVSTEENGWYVRDEYRTGHRSGDQNPWNADPWPENQTGSLPSDDGNLFPSARFFMWYASGEPRAETEEAKDSGLGQSGPDPCGVMPATFYCMYVPDWVPDDKPAWSTTNLSIDKWLEAIDTFGPRGTKAMFFHPDGYIP
jgi:hypothetical protein